jgi:hypothetical protein
MKEKEKEKKNKKLQTEYFCWFGMTRTQMDKNK